METTAFSLASALRDYMVASNRARTAELRSRMLAKPGRFLVDYAEIRARGAAAQDAFILSRRMSDGGNRTYRHGATQLET